LALQTRALSRSWCRLRADRRSIRRLDGRAKATAARPLATSHARSASEEVSDRAGRRRSRHGRAGRVARLRRADEAPPAWLSRGESPQCEPQGGWG